jgi:hypothetical protein
MLRRRERVWPAPGGTATVKQGGHGESQYTWDQPFCFSDGAEEDACSDWVAAFPGLGEAEVVAVDAESMEVPLQVVTAMRARGLGPQVLRDLLSG